MRELGLEHALRHRLLQLPPHPLEVGAGLHPRHQLVEHLGRQPCGQRRRRRPIPSSHNHLSPTRS